VRLIQCVRVPAEDPEANDQTVPQSEDLSNWRLNAATGYAADGVKEMKGHDDIAFLDVRSFFVGHRYVMSPQGLIALAKDSDPFGAVPLAAEGKVRGRGDNDVGAQRSISPSHPRAATALSMSTTISVFVTLPLILDGSQG